MFSPNVGENFFWWNKMKCEWDMCNMILILKVWQTSHKAYNKV
jgi:hypothetical protein